MPGGPYTADVGQAVSFDGSRSTGAAGQSLTYAWDFGDGSTGAGECRLTLLAPTLPKA